LSKKTGFTAAGEVRKLFSAVLMTGLEPSAASDRAGRHGNLDGKTPDLVRVTGVLKTIARARKPESIFVPSFLTG
jgi:hypothetical protein